MTLPSSGPLKLSQIAAEFGVSLPCVFPDDFYGKPGVPTSGALSFSDFYGLSNVIFTPDGGDVGSGGMGDGTTDIYCNKVATWTFTLPAGITSSVPSGGSTSHITFSRTGDGSNTFAVHGVALGVARNFNCTVTKLSGGGGV